MSRLEFAARTNPALHRTLIQVHVFPIPGAILFPNSNVPLNIFEPRYNEMVQDSFTKGIPIAVCSRAPGTGRLVAGFGLPYLIERRDDDSMLILIRGQGKAEIRSVLQEEPYFTCLARTLIEDEDLNSLEALTFSRLKSILFAWLEASTPQPEQQAFLKQALHSPLQIVESLTDLLVEDHSMKQLVLESDALSEKVAILDALFDREGVYDGAHWPRG